jgi:hypothetical protein
MRVVRRFCAAGARDFLHLAPALPHRPAGNAEPREGRTMSGPVAWPVLRLREGKFPTPGTRGDHMD